MRRPSSASVCLALAIGVGTERLQAQEQPGYSERVDVTRILVDARVVDGTRPVENLRARDFRVRIGGHEARVESATAVRAFSPPATLPSEPNRVLPGAPPPALPEGRLVVLLFQKSLDDSRIGGFLRVLLEAREFIDSFTPQDRVAVVTFDASLRVSLDFTGELERVRQAVGRDVLFGSAHAVASESGVSLLARLTPERSRRVATIEDALVALGEALEPLPGAKVVVFVGHGFGRLGPSGVRMEPRYEAARRALEDARASVVCLDVTNADYHSLGAGLQRVADHTGGFYVRAHQFTGSAVRRVAAVLGGHYVLMVEQPTSLRPGRHRIVVDLVDRPGEVYARRELLTAER